MKSKVAWFSSLLEHNLHWLRWEAHETAEVYRLWRRARRGTPLSFEERRRVRAQLIDLAKAIPALVVFAAPGGLVLLVVLGKVLPFSLLPSAFRTPPPPPTAAPAPAPSSDDGPPVREAG